MGMVAEAMNIITVVVKKLVTNRLLNQNININIRINNTAALLLILLFD